MDRIIPGERRSFSDEEFGELVRLGLLEIGQRLWKEVRLAPEALERALRLAAGLPRSDFREPR